MIIPKYVQMLVSGICWPQKGITQWTFNPSSRKSYCLTFTAIYFHRVNQNSLKLNGTNQFLVYDDVNTLGGSLHTVKKHTSCQ